MIKNNACKNYNLQCKSSQAEEKGGRDRSAEIGGQKNDRLATERIKKSKCRRYV